MAVVLCRRVAVANEFTNDPIQYRFRGASFAMVYMKKNLFSPAGGRGNRRILLRGAFLKQDRR
jgi:hypothetical protein